MSVSTLNPARVTVQTHMGTGVDINQYTNVIMLRIRDECLLIQNRAGEEWGIPLANISFWKVEA